MQRFTEAWNTKEKYLAELIRLGASSVNLAFKARRPNGKIQTVQIVMRVLVTANDGKLAIEKFLAGQRHLGRLDRFPVEIVVLERKPSTQPQ